MKKIFLLIGVSITASALGLTLFGCAKSNNKILNGNADIEPGRSFKLDSSTKFVQLSIYGTEMGTPDGEKVDFLLRSLDDAGRIIDLKLLKKGIEGGGLYCFRFPSNANKTVIYELLRSVKTDPSRTMYSVLSADSCETADDSKPRLFEDYETAAEE